ncbi:hypothetical protein HYH02_001848 [Chlamydomonas schloesseri]|uniref:ABM domain-containing protein n=1 Tax=Chlamydomonas schloesseri TaxID=2026947 RepID=A0A836BC94_9CHLO|nr:hypothetical protein HYH02_001848 [Chlamydomonas schloesseri]|eukprot:KAG2453635.1 hypothetical protein HYH02_001848 [Chlamydomonas schloesseri]
MQVASGTEMLRGASSARGERQCFRQLSASRGRLVVVAANKVRSKKQVACSRTLVAKPGHETEVARLSGQILEYTHGKGDKQILEYTCVRDGWEANTFHFWERYETPTAFGEHTTTPRMVQLLTELQPHLTGPIGISLYSYENGMLGPASMQEGPKGEGGLDDATGASGAAGGASYKQTSRAFDLTKVNEHEEAEREQQLLNSMAAGATAAGAQPAQPGSAAKAVAAAEKEREAEGPRGLPTPTPGSLLAMAAGAKDAVMGSLCRLFRFKH